MSAPRMSDSLVSVLGQRVRHHLEDSLFAFQRALVSRPVQPMTTYTNNFKFEVTTPQDGAREFQISLSISEQPTPDGTPDSNGHLVTR